MLRQPAYILLAVLLVGLGGCPAKRPTADQPARPGDEKTAPPVVVESPKPSPSLADWPKPLATFVLTGQQMGYIEPCGCTGLENQKGGLARRHTLIQQLKNDRGWSVVPLDVGGQVKRFGKQQEIKFAHTVQGLRSMGYRAIGFGEGDLRLTPGELLAAISGPDGTVSDFVSSNVAVLARELQPRWLVIEAGGQRIGVAAVLGDKYESHLRGDELLHEPAAAALATLTPELKQQGCNFHILLVHAPLDEARKLAEAAPLFDLVVASGETSLPSSDLEQVGGKTRLLQLGQKAMYVGVVGLYDDPATPLRYESVPLDGRFADSPEMLKLLADYQQQLKDLGLDELGLSAPPHPSGRKFVGSQQCAACHTEAYEKWSQTTHAHATDSLVSPPNSRGEIARHFDPECLSCHVTGWEPQQFHPYESGFLSLEQTPLLKHSGCENCHGPGSAHVAAESGATNASADSIAKLREAMKLPLADEAAHSKCIQCHDIDNSPDFHKPGAFERYWKAVEH